jgi:hypothetical protein
MTHNKGTSSYTFTGCVFEYKLSSAKKYTKGTCGINASFTITPGQKLKGTWTTSWNGAAGTYDAKVYYTSSTEMSGVGAFTFTVP